VDGSRDRSDNEGTKLDLEMPISLKHCEALGWSFESFVRKGFLWKQTDREIPCNCWISQLGRSSPVISSIFRKGLKHAS
jgi:hypothetical protein